MSLSVISINSVFRACKNYCCQGFLEERKYIVKEKKMSNYNSDKREISSDDSDKENSDE